MAKCHATAGAVRLKAGPSSCTVSLCSPCCSICRNFPSFDTCPMSEVHVLYPRNIKDISSSVLAAPGRPRVMPAVFYQNTTLEERALFGLCHGIYGLPTEELVDWLKREIHGRSALEIGAGHGALAEALGIPATDNWMQANRAIAAHYESHGQPVVKYGQHVEKLDAAAAVAKHRPQVVIASWVTHKYSPFRHEAGGNEFGVDEEAILAACETYILIGNTKVHARTPMWRHVHRIIHPDWLYSRSFNGTKDFIAVWGK